MLQKFIDYIETNKLAEKTGRILLAVSGGVDSMVMAHLFSKTGFYTAIAHCNFRLRGKDSDMDEEFVREYAKLSGREFFCKGFNTSDYANSEGISIEMAARELRYKWFEEISNKHGFNYIALAHHKNDSIETMLINLIRGTGVDGLTGIKPVSGKLIRPMLFATRREIEEYALSESIQWREDKTNKELLYVRNRIRHIIIPVIREINPSFEDTMAETAERFSEVRELLDSCTENIRSKVSVEAQGNTVFNIQKLKECRPLKTVLFELFRPYGIGPGQIPLLAGLLDARTGAMLFTDTHRIIKNRNDLVVTGLPDGVKPEYIANDIEELRQIPFIAKAETEDLATPYVIPTDPYIAWLDAGTIRFPLKIRGWNQGDRFQPLGMNSFKKLSDYFIDRKLPRHVKEKVLVLESGGEIAWVMGERIDHRFRVTGNTKKVLVIEISDKYHL